MCPTIFNVDFKQVFDRMVAYLVGIFLFKVNSRNTRAMCEKFLKLTTKAL